MTRAPSITTICTAAQKARARIGLRVLHTPIVQSRSQNGELHYKTENFQRTGSFKIRGAMSILTRAVERTDDEPPKFITASSGNHGIGASAAATDLGLEMCVVLPETVAPMKLDRIRALGANVVLHGEEAGASELHAQVLASQEGYTYISPYNDEDVIAGQGTIGLELLDDFSGETIDNIFISLGGGGLVSGIGAVLKTMSPRTRVWGVSASNSAALDASIKAGRVVETDHLPTLADAVAGGIDNGTITLPLATETIDRTLTCDEAAIAGAFRILAFEDGIIAEGSAALALAGYLEVRDELRGQKNVVLLCGGNISREQTVSLLAAKD